MFRPPTLVRSSFDGTTEWRGNIPRYLINSYGGSMLNTAKLEAFVGTADPEKARHFYQTVLGLSMIADAPFALMFDANGTRLLVSKVDEVSPAPYTVLGWTVPDIASMTKALRKKGVVFERFPYFDQDDNDVWVAPSGVRVAWFKDPDGNTLSVSQYA